MTGRSTVGEEQSPAQSFSTPALRKLRAHVREFLAEALRSGAYEPSVDAWVQGIDPAFSQELARRGWVGMAIPTEYGGRGEGALRRWVVTEELLAAGAPVAAHWIGDRQIAPSILAHGSQAQKRTYLPRIAAAECFFCLGMSEPEAGSDLAAIRTRAVRQDDGSWVLNGTKLWTSHAQVAHGMLLLARSEPLGEVRQAGLSQFLVDLPHPGITIRPIGTIDGAAHFNEVLFTDAHLPADALLGTEGRGWSQVTAELAYERSGPERIMSSVPLLLAWGDRLRDTGTSDPRAREEFARLMGRLAVLRRMSFGVAEALERGIVPANEAAMVKLLGGDFEQDVVDTVSRLSPVEPDFAAADRLAVLLAQAITHGPTFTIRGGASDILGGIVAKGLGMR